MRSMVSIDHGVIGLVTFHGYSFKGAANDVAVEVCSLRAAVCVPVRSHHFAPQQAVVGLRDGT